MNTVNQGVPLKILIVALGLIFLFFVILYENHARNQAQAAVEEHARIISDALWYMDPKGTNQYLSAVATANDYESTRVTNEKGHVFIEIGSRDLNNFETLLINLKLISRLRISTNVFFNEKMIGRIEVMWRKKTIYLYSYVLLVSALIVIVVQLYNRVLRAKQTLESKVEERTTDLIRTNRGLLESEDRFRTLVANIPGVIYRCANDSDRTMHFISNAINDISGYRASDFYKNRVRSLDSIIHPDDKETVRAALEKGLMKDEPYTIEYRIINKNGKAHWVYERGQILTGDNNEIKYLDGAIFDITERKEVEEELGRYHKHLEELVKERTGDLEFARDRAEDMDRLKSAFLATMSHELRTPLNSIIGFTGIILQGLAGPLNDEQNKQLGMVKSSALHLLNLINDVLDISKIESGQLTVFNENFDMHESINKIVKSVTPLSEGKGLALVADITPEAVQITSDKQRVEQILINLVNNAIKFTEKGEVRIKCRTNGSRLITSVTDTGIGIEPGDMESLFKPFRQIDSSIERQYEGTGLGLSICKKILDILGGEIIVESRRNVGSTFTFTLPLEVQETGK